MTAAWHPMVARVDPEADKPTPEGHKGDDWADDLEGPTEGIFDRRVWAAMDAITVRPRKGYVPITDGPFTETKE